MKMNILHYVKEHKFDIIWCLLTILLVVSINIAYMYSRDRTLSTVEKNQFKIFSNLMQATSLNEKLFLKVSESLTIIPKSSQVKTRQALFHIALITSKKCVENGLHPRNFPLLCRSFPTSNAIQKILKSHHIDIENPYKMFEIEPISIGIDDSHHRAYLFQKRMNTHKWLISKKRYLSNSSDWQKLYFFLTKRYLQTTSLKSKLYYTRFSNVIIPLFSFILWFLFKLMETKKIKNYKMLTKKNNYLKSKLIELDKAYNELKNDLYVLEQDITEDELKLISDQYFGNDNKKTIITNLRKKTITQAKKYEELHMIRNEVIRLEAENEIIENLINEKRSNLNPIQRNIEYNKLYGQNMQLKQLWRHEPTWIERRDIEIHASLVADNLPFTITQAFLAFEKYIDNEIENSFKKNEAKEVLEKTLIEKIKIISKKKPLSIQEQDIFHKIRKARNKWVHGAIYPSKELLNELLIILETTDITPPI